MNNKMPKISRKWIPDLSGLAKLRSDFSSSSGSPTPLWKTVAFILILPFIIIVLLAIAVVAISVFSIGRVTGLIKPFSEWGKEAPLSEDEFNEQIEWLLEEADDGDGEAMSSLGALYETGCDGVPDYEQAIKWYQAAASHGERDAQFKLANLYQSGTGIERDEVQALKWYQAAGSQGDPYAQFKLANIYADGRGTERDNVQAFMWCELALECEYMAEFSEDHDFVDEVERLLEKLKFGMTKSQIDEARDLVESSFKKPGKK